MNAIEHLGLLTSIGLLLMITLRTWITGLTSQLPLSDRQINVILLLFLNCSMTAVLIERWILDGHIPLANLYESCLTLSWLLITLATYLHLYVWRTFLFLPIALVLNLFAYFLKDQPAINTISLVPALKSQWLTMHVSMMIISYAFLILGSLCAILWITLKHSSVDMITQSEVDTVALVCFQKRQDRFSSSLDTWSYRLIVIGFPVLSLGIVSGAVWANETWGTYWSWDPKETWAFLTWIVFAIYLHVRLNTRYVSPIMPAMIASLGLAVVWMCYLGVNLLGQGLHNYGWFY